MGIPVAPVVDLALCVAFHICSVNNGYSQQRMKLCQNGVTVMPEQKCPKSAEQQQNTVGASAPPPPTQPTVIDGGTATVPQQPTVIGGAPTEAFDTDTHD